MADQQTMTQAVDASVRLTDIIMIVAVIAGPIVAVWLTVFLQNRKEKRDEMRRLFLTLMAHRRSMVMPPDFVNALNTIDVVFAKVPAVVAKWHTYYALLCAKQAGTEAANHAYLEMLSEMAAALGYSELKQTDIDKFYTPQGHADELNMQGQIAREWLRVLGATARFEAAPRPAPPDPPEGPKDPPTGQV